MGKVFELPLDGDAPENQPLEMVRRDGYMGKWSHHGPTVKGKQTRRFKFVAVGYCHDFAELMRKLAEHGHGAIPEGQWREALKASYAYDSKGSVGVVDSSWVDLCGNACFPCISAVGDSRFFWAHYGFYDSWRWLVEASKPR